MIGRQHVNASRRICYGLLRVVYRVVRRRWAEELIAEREVTGNPRHYYQERDKPYHPAIAVAASIIARCRYVGYTGGRRGITGLRSLVVRRIHTLICGRIGGRNLRLSRARPHQSGVIIERR